MMYYFLLIFVISSITRINSLPPAEDFKSTIPSQRDLYWGLDKPQVTYTLPELPFPPNAMEPYIDARTMELHYGSIHKHYTSKLNDLMKAWRASGENVELANTSLINIWRNLKAIPKIFARDFRYYGGGYINHVLYFATMTPNPKDEMRAPTEKFGELIANSFYNISILKKDMDTTAYQIFGSGYVWLARVTGPSSREYLTITATLEEICPVEHPQMFPILALDVWEHAYFIKYGNNRAEYIKNWWKTVDWIKVERIYNWWKMQEPLVHSDL